eukprot:677665-Pyramimonas_sp.AAC.1
MLLVVFAVPFAFASGMGGLCGRTLCSVSDVVAVVRCVVGRAVVVPCGDDAGRPPQIGCVLHSRGTGGKQQQNTLPPLPKPAMVRFA